MSKTNETGPSPNITANSGRVENCIQTLLAAMDGFTSAEIALAVPVAQRMVWEACSKIDESTNGLAN